jgi:hypothetical protein
VNEWYYDLVLVESGQAHHELGVVQAIIVILFYVFSEAQFFFFKRKKKRPGVWESFASYLNVSSMFGSLTNELTRGLMSM